MQDLLAEIIQGGVERIQISDEAVDLRDAYLKTGIVTDQYEDDAMHVALATLVRADVIASWNFRHLVNPSRIRGFNGVNAMQGYGSAVTYARRYGLMAMAGIAPEDDDGNAAAKAAPKVEPPKPISADQFQEMNDLIFDTETDEVKFCAYWKVDELTQMNAKQASDAIAMLAKKKSKQEEDNGTAD